MPGFPLTYFTQNMKQLLPWAAYGLFVIAMLGAVLMGRAKKYMPAFYLLAAAVVVLAFTTSVRQ